jgi:CheY-like chemotaxis protein
VDTSSHYRKKILVVDDHLACREAVSMILQDSLKDDCEVRTAEHSYEALELVEFWRPDLIIQDIARPDMDGWEFLRELRKEHPFLPVIILTAYSSEQARRTSMEAGAFAHIAKPIDWEALVHAVAKALASTKDGEQRKPK